MKKNKAKYSMNIFQMLRLCNDLKIPELAETIGISQQYVRDIENGYRYPSDEVLEKYCKALNVSLETFRSLEDLVKRNQDDKTLNNYQKVLFFILTKLVKL